MLILARLITFTANVALCRVPSSNVEVVLTNTWNDSRDTRSSTRCGSKRNESFASAFRRIGFPRLQSTRVALNWLHV